MKMVWTLLGLVAFLLGVLMGLRALGRKRAA